LFGVSIRLFREAAFREKGKYGALRNMSWVHLGWRRNHFRGWGKLESEGQFRLTTGESLKPKTSLTALFPKVCHMGELVLGKGMGCGGPRS
jgi:hypothetical protein